MIEQTFEGQVEQFHDNSLYTFHVPVPQDVLLYFREHNVKRLICNYNGMEDIHLSLVPDGLGGAFLHINKEWRKKLGVDLHDKVRVKLREDKSKYGMFVPPSFEELLLQDPEGAHYFESLTPGKKRSLLHHVGKFKSEQKQIEKGFIVLGYLKEVKGKLDFKELHEAFKQKKF